MYLLTKFFPGKIIQRSRQTKQYIGCRTITRWRRQTNKQNTTTRFTFGCYTFSFEFSWNHSSGENIFFFFLLNDFVCRDFCWGRGKKNILQFNSTIFDNDVNMSCSKRFYVCFWNNFFVFLNSSVMFSFFLNETRDTKSMKILKTIFLLRLNKTQTFN